jgi:hypothetical protein
MSRGSYLWVRCTAVLALQRDVFRGKVASWRMEKQNHERGLVTCYIVKKGTAREVAGRLQIASKMFVALFNCPRIYNGGPGGAHS